MDDEALFGRVVYRLEYGEAVARGIVAPLKLVFLNISEAYERVALASGAAVPRDDLVELSAALLDCHEQYGVRTAFAFCASNRRAAELERVARRELASRGMVLGRVSGAMRAEARARVRVLSSRGGRILW